MELLDYFRITAILFGFSLQGFILSAMVRAKEITRYYRAWRVFLTGQLLMIVFVILTLDQAVKEDLPIGWRLPIALLSFAISIGSISRLHHYHIFHGKHIHPLPSFLRRSH
jgi:hypothetical protein